MVELTGGPIAGAMDLRPGLLGGRCRGGRRCLPPLIGGRIPEGFECCGGKVIEKIWSPIATQAFGPCIPRMKPDADALYTVMVGPMALRFPVRICAPGFKKPIMGEATSDDEFTLPFMDDEAIGDDSAPRSRGRARRPSSRSMARATAACRVIIRKPPSARGRRSGRPQRYRLAACEQNCVIAGTARRTFWLFKRTLK